MYYNDPQKLSNVKHKYESIINAIVELHPSISFEEALFLVKNNLSNAPLCPNCGNVISFNPRTYKYKKYCSQSCSAQHNNPFADIVIIDGIQYKDFPTAMKLTGESREDIRSKIFNHHFPTYRWGLCDHDEKCQKKLASASPVLTDKNALVEWKKSRITQSVFANANNISTDQLRCALLYWDIESIFDQIPEDAQQIRDNRHLLEDLYKTYTSDEIAQLYHVSPSAVQLWLYNHGIPIDQSKSQSKIERDYIAAIQEWRPDLTLSIRDKTALNGVEIDIYIPELKYGIEFNGLYFHSDDPLFPQKKRHSTKQKLAYREGIKLVQFFDIGETDRPSSRLIVDSMIRHSLGLSNRIFARKCVLREIDSSTGNAFFKANHISGTRNAKIYVGLFYSGELVQCMSFGHTINKTSKYEWELVRLASKLNTIVVGGASKLFNHFLGMTTGNVLSYCDLRLGNGDVYKSLGFSHTGKTAEGYFYTDLNKCYSRYQFQKSSIESVCKVYDPHKTEFENASANGFRIVWNCGNLIYEYCR